MSIIQFADKKGIICDMDGVIYHGNQILPGVKEFIDWLHAEKKDYLFLTNSSDKTRQDLRRKLARMGLSVSEDHFYTSALATAEFLRRQSPGCSAYVIGEAGLYNALYNAGISMNDVDPDYVVLGESKTYTMATVTKAINLVMNGAKLIGANPDVCDPMEGGICPSCGALIAPIEMATGRHAYFCGKPNPLMMRTGLRLLGCHSDDALIIGDRMDTDIVAGTETGVDTVLVLSGVSTMETVKSYAYHPTVIFNGVGDIVAIDAEQKAKKNKEE